MALVFGGCYFDPPHGQAFDAYKNRFTFAFLSLFFATLVQMQSIPLYFEDRVMFYRERKIKLYNPVLYWVACWLTYASFVLLHHFVFTVIAYFMAKFLPTIQNVTVFFVTLYLGSMTGYFVCQFIAVLSPNPQTAMGIYPIVVFTNLLYAGFLQFIPSMQHWLSGWAPYVSFFRWGYQALVLNEYVTNPELEYTSYYINLFGFNTYTVGQCLGILVLYIAVFIALVSIGILKTDFEKR